MDSFIWNSTNHVDTGWSYLNKSQYITKELFANALQKWIKKERLYPVSYEMLHSFSYYCCQRASQKNFTYTCHTNNPKSNPVYLKQ